MKRPSFQFYPADWMANPNLKRCTFEERGVWVEVMCLMHDQDEYGVIRWPLDEIATAIRCDLATLTALVKKDVLKGDDNELMTPFIYTPRSGRKDGEPVTLLEPQAGPIWYSSRMVRDEHVRIKRSVNDERNSPKAAPKATPKAAPKPPFGEGIGEPIGGGFDVHPSPAQAPRAPPSSSSSSSSSPSEINTPATQVVTDAPASDDVVDVAGHEVMAPKAPDCPHAEILALWAEVMPELQQPNPDLWQGTRADHLRARWRQVVAGKTRRTKAEGIDYFRRLFGHIRGSLFLMGRVPPASGRAQFTIDIGWLVNPSNWAKVHEGNYHKEIAYA